jgi:diazepam-binding inhibitor (GABA receptor modulating acyl-CoA-binding protein)
MAVDQGLELKFKKAVHLIRHGPPKANTSTDEKLKFYSLFKQATEGDVKGDQPWAVQFEARAKWDAWAKLRGMSKEEAMRKYIELVEEGKKLRGVAKSAPHPHPHPSSTPTPWQGTPPGRTTRRWRDIRQRPSEPTLT